MVSAIERTYSDNGVATEQQERWDGPLSDGSYGYLRTILENSWDAQGRAERSIQRQWAGVSGRPSGAAAWSSTVFGYREGAYSAFTWSWPSSGDPASRPKLVLTHQQDFVIDSRGTVINTRDLFPEMGNEKKVTVTFHPNGVEASESWDGWFSPYPHELGATTVFDESGNVLQLDNLYYRAGYGEDKSHVTYTYDRGRLDSRRVENSHYISWDRDLLLSDAVINEIYTYDVDGAHLKAIDSSENDADCPYTWVGQTPVSTCTWRAGPRLHTAFSYDSAGNLASRVVTDADANELSRYTAVSDADGNLLCESQTEGSLLRLFKRYDYSCW